MEAGAEVYYGMASRDLSKTSLEWDPSEWRWDGDLFIATPLNHQGKQLFPATRASSNTSSSYSEDVNRDSRELEKKRPANNNYNLGDNLTLATNGSAGKKSKLGGGVCQVEDCAADLSKAKDYHRRHKVCEMHSKASKALVGNQMQRFCQQCSRFHSLEEFDDGKRSCRRRLAGHNKRRRKIQTDSNPVNNNQTSTYLLMSLLKILSSVHSNRSDHIDDQDLVSHLLQGLATQGSAQDLLSNLASGGNSELVSMLRSREEPKKAGVETCGGRIKLNNFDLNDVYVDSDDGMEEVERSTVPHHQSSPPQTSGNSDSASAHSPSSSSGEAQVQSYTDRIVFKLFGKEPSDFPIDLRAQIFDWLSHSPTDIESYIRPGCVVLTIYLRLYESSWEELYCDLNSSLGRLLSLSDDVDFWTAGWIYARVQNQMAFVYNGQVVVNTSLPLGTDNFSSILSIKPIAVASSGQAHFTVKGFNLSRPSSRLLCALEGDYLEGSSELMEHVDYLEGHVQSLKYSCSIPAVTGRGFIEVEDHGLSSSYFPFIVAEEDVCAEIRMLEKEMELIELDHLQRGTGQIAARSQAMEFIHEMGWLLHKYHLKAQSGHDDSNLRFFPFERFKSLVEFSMDRDWCSVVNKLLDVLFSGTVSAEEQPLLKFAMSEMSLLHRAVRRNSRSLVEMLLRYVPEKVVDELRSEYGSLVEIDQGYLFRPDAAGPGGLTPLHVAAGRDGSDDILDALTDDPGKVGIDGWKSAVDSTGFTPENYARLRGHYTYIHLIQRKMNKVPSSSGHVVVDILSESSMNQKANAAVFEIAKKVPRRPCGACGQNLAHATGSRTLLYRPTMLSMLAIAAVCVCVALLFKSSPQVLFVFRPFSWEMLEYGSS